MATGMKRTSIWVHCRGTPIALCPARAEFSGPLGDRILEKRSNAQGVLTIEHGPDEKVDVVLLAPVDRYWSHLLVEPEDGSEADLSLLPLNGPTAWWHRALGLDAVPPGRGSGIRIGVVDTGCAHHPHLYVRDRGAVIDGVLSASGRDVRGHGTHVCGLIAAVPGTDGFGYSGCAPGSDIVSVRVFEPGHITDQGDVAEGIGLLLREGVHLINLSLGSEVRSEVLHYAIRDASKQGVLVFAAAGNSGREVQFPALLAETVAVGAIGRSGWGEPPSLSWAREAVDHRSEGFFVPTLSCRGPEVGCCAPGVGIISTVPPSERHSAPYGVMDGTSMATPLACGYLAGLLGEDEVYLRMRPDSERTAYARRLLNRSCRDLGFPAHLQGAGLVSR